jgi:hypothetical protein
MRKMFFVVTFAVFSFVASEASAVTVLNTTQADVKKQCAGKTECTTACGSTLCSYNCTNPQQQCTVAVFFQRPKPGRHPRPANITGAKASIR